MYKLMSYMEKNVSFDFYPTGDDSYKKFRKTLKKPTNFLKPRETSPSRPSLLHAFTNVAMRELIDTEFAA